MHFRLLGPLRVYLTQPGGLSHVAPTLDVRGRRQEVILAMLLVNLGHTVTTSRIADALWDSVPPRTYRQQVQNCASALRRTFEETVPNEPLEPGGQPSVELTAEASGYRLRAQRASVDACVFEDSVRAATNGNHVDDTDAAEQLRSALGLWRGTPLAGLSATELRAEAARLQELRLLAIEELTSRELRVGREPGLHIAELAALVQHHPYRERLWLLLMDALHRCGRTAEALGRFREYRELLVRDHGVEPSDAIRAKEREILQQTA